MSSYAKKIQKTMMKPVYLVFRLLQKRHRVQVWLMENNDLRMEGRIIVNS